MTLINPWQPNFFKEAIINHWQQTFRTKWQSSTLDSRSLERWQPVTQQTFTRRRQNQPSTADLYKGDNQWHSKPLQEDAKISPRQLNFRRRQTTTAKWNCKIFKMAPSPVLTQKGSICCSWHRHFLLKWQRAKQAPWPLHFQGAFWLVAWTRICRLYLYPPT